MPAKKGPGPFPLVLAGFWLLLLIALSTPLPFRSRLANSFFDLCHAPFFAVLAYLVFRFAGQRFSPPAVAAKLVCGIALVLFGAGTEGIQWFVGRQPSAYDLWSNACGAAAGALFQLSSNVRRRIRAAAASLGLAILAAALFAPALTFLDAVRQLYEMPLIGSFERSRELERWSGQLCGYERVAQHASHGTHALRVDLQAGDYPGISLDPAANWSGYGELRFDLYLSGDQPLEIVVKLFDIDHDGEYEDRFNRRLLLEPGSNPIRLELADVADSPQNRQLDLARVRGFSLFAARLSRPRAIFLDNVRLE